MKLHNTLTKQTEEVKPIGDNSVTLYTCGPTVYDYPHIGNWFAFVRWDVLARLLKKEFKEINWVMNITDVGHLVSDDDAGEDKLEKGARRENKTAWAVAEYYSRYFVNALHRLNFMDITAIPKATDHIPEQISLVKKLEEKGFTYTIEDGVYFDTSKLHDYGKLTNLNKEHLLAGARVEPAPGKKNITDFALWKFSPKGQKRDMEWNSPWGKGFPGWHIECSAMSMKYLGETLDIHAGGIDHIPVHHTNEIAQSEAATDKPFANIWVHSNFIKVDGRKMSKSLGNLVTLEQIEQKGFDLQAFRLLVLESHYRSEAQFTWEVLEAANNRLKKWQSVADLRLQPKDDNDDIQKELDHHFFATAENPILNALKDDLNTPKALSYIDQIFEKVEITGVRKDDVASYNTFLVFINAQLGINLLKDPLPEEVLEILNKRQSARQKSDWQTSDKLRNELAKKGIGVKDTSSGQIWERL